MSIQRVLHNGINAFPGEKSGDKANQFIRYTCGEREGTCPGGLGDRSQKEDSAGNMRGIPVPSEGSIGGSGRRQATRISKGKEEPWIGSGWPFPAHKPGDNSSEDFKEVHNGHKFCCSKCPRKFNTKSNMVKHEDMYPCTPPSGPSGQLTWSGWRPYTHEPGDKSGGARSISDRGEEDFIASLREEADNLYSCQGNPHAPPSDPKAEVITKKMEKSHIRP